MYHVRIDTRLGWALPLLFYFSLGRGESLGTRLHAAQLVRQTSRPYQPRPLPVASDGELVDVAEEGSLQLWKNAT